MEHEKISRTNAQIDRLSDIIRTLRSPEGCPWDRRQTPRTMWKCLVEEVYELLEAIEKDLPDEICEETGDVLFQLVFIAELYREKGQFDLSDAIALIASKMVRRHPHVYQDMSLSGDEELHSRWDSIKKEEKRKAGKDAHDSVLDSVPSGMPALLRSYKVSERVVRYGFDWEDLAGVIRKVEEEWGEFERALEGGDRDEIESEFGDILFTLSNVARFAGIHPETALARSTEKFEKRFRYMEKDVKSMGIDLKNLSPDEVDALWEKAKKAVSRLK